MLNNKQDKVVFDEKTESNIKNWLEGNYDEDSKQEIQRLLKENPKELGDAFYTSLSFGTGGLRGLMGVGSNRMNIYTVGTCIQALCNYLKKQSEPSKFLSVIIGYDSRHHSRKLAETAAQVLAANGIKAFLFKALCPTPLVSFGCRFKNCSAAIVITASHNPPQYNGCKVYWSDGGQVLPPHDKGIMDEMKLLDNIKDVKTLKNLNHHLIEEINGEIDVAYCEMISELQNYPTDNHEKGNTLKVIYTSLHGTGITLIPKALSSWGFTNLHYVDSQISPDGNFPTLTSLNPEEPEALTLGIAELEKEQGDLLLATDPDGDRVAVAIQHNGQVELLNGNQVASLILDHICVSLTARNKMPANAGFIKTVVTTELFSAIADYYHGHCFNVLTGFKYIAGQIHKWEDEANSPQFIFGGEESYGYLSGTSVRDKDGVSSSALICEMALQAKLKGKTLKDLLNDLYTRHGIYYEKLSTLSFKETKEGRAQITKIIEQIQKRPPEKISEYEVIAIEDYNRSVKNYLKSSKSETLTLPKSDVFIFWLNDGSKIVIRPSGTEPKIKIYCSVVEKEFVSIESGMEEAKRRADSIIESLIQFSTNI